MADKLRYEIDLADIQPAEARKDILVRTATGEDLQGLARLMLDAYVGTIDYDDETLDDAMGEVGSFLDDPDSALEHSYVVEEGGVIVSAVLVSMPGGVPFIGYVMTLPSHKEQGLGRLLVTVVMERLAAVGHERVVLYITEGNVASEALFRSVGAVRRRD